MFEDKVEVIYDLSFIKNKLKWCLFLKTVEKMLTLNFAINLMVDLLGSYPKSRLGKFG